jgi:hypothetical protein
MPNSGHVLKSHHVTGLHTVQYKNVSIKYTTGKSQAKMGTMRPFFKLKTENYSSKYLLF